MTVTFYPLCAMVMTYSHAKVQGQQSVGSKAKMETNGWTDRRTEATALPPSPMQSVKIYVILEATESLHYRNLSHFCWTDSVVEDISTGQQQNGLP